MDYYGHQTLHHMLKQDHLAAQCNIKKQIQERRQARHQLANRHGHLYQKYKPAGTTAMRRFLANQQQFQGRSFASVAANKFKSNRNPPPRITQRASPPAQQIALNADMAQVLSSINKIVAMVNDIKADLQKIDQRIQYLEEDAYYYHNRDDWEKDESKESPVTSNTA